MQNSLKTLAARVNCAVDWFIPEKLKSSPDLLQGVRMFLFSHLFGPFLGHTISLYMLYIQGGADLSWWIFFLAITAFWPFPFVLRITGWYVPLALLSIQNLMFCVFWGCYQYGGVSSPILPWLVTVPLLAFFYLPERKTRIIVSLLIVANLSVFYGMYSAVGFRPTVSLGDLVVLGLISTFCASVYVSMMALYYANIVSSQAELEQEVDRHKATAHQLREATLQVERAMLAKSEFLAKMSHELRNPLNSIIGYSEILIEGLDPSKDQKYRDLTSIRSAGHRLLELINDLLDLSKLEAGKMELHSDRINFNDLFDELAAKWASVVAESGNRFKVEPAPATEIICDAPKLRRVIENLLSNAAKFTKGGCILLTASIEAGTLTVVVEDSGVGIAESEIEGLFETFGNSDQETASNYGDDVRLGLPLAHRYCRLMGGELSVKSKLGLGSRFILRVPVQLVADQIKMPSEKQTMGRAA
ncbi:MAG: HAMP domain-containing sensor histidine kinase [Xanthobacteraceae bacterium]